jgi:hypothetical protein
MQQSVGGGEISFRDWPHPILGVLQPDEKIGILRFDNCTFKYTSLDCSGGENYRNFVDIERGRVHIAIIQQKIEF